MWGRLARATLVEPAQSSPKEEAMSTRTLATRLSGATLLASATLFTVGAPAFAQVAPEPNSGEVRVVTMPQAATGNDLEVGQIALGALAGAALAGVGVAASRAMRRPSARPA
jgi:hypothetical protein